ncbi:NADH dehydrogenase [ubiquinone] 1 beta subcomplex subunit 5, mitochondrial [Neocloeon triangulifer]|uniref:NADH dehydrogenase [ubiquinone] 1 beta subcomplex subunit 5, mitochondrial n=1 Tax=Neocloeon triangulifer TaxID=2078957 RepID=UPI00286EF303|nr:NADH dehydrogenase [ubiquinone] 1 beta subcomplex subunit 5, mitochondrial [Neocloeon triangulifer]
MAVWSTLAKPRQSSAVLQGIRRLLGPNTTSDLRNGITQQIRCGGGHHREFFITPSRFQWKKFKDLFHFYVLIGAIPIGLTIFYTNVFIGPATLTPIPEGYTPKYWEYYRHPITRFFSRYILSNPQMEYERTMNTIYEEEERRQLYLLEKKVKQLMGERRDYQAYYYSPNTAIKYYRKMREVKEGDVARAGDNL